MSSRQTDSRREADPTRQRGPAGEAKKRDAMSLAWRDAMLASPAIESAFRDMRGWLDRLTPGHIAILQRPFQEARDTGVPGTPMTAELRRCHALQRAIEAACKAGILASESHTVARSGSGTTDVHCIAAIDFVQWLEDQGETPSVHVQNWLKATQKAAADASPFPLADFRALVTYRKANGGTSWTAGNQIDIAKAELQNRGGNQSGNKNNVLAALAKELGLGSAQALRRALTAERKRRLG